MLTGQFQFLFTSGKDEFFTPEQFVFGGDAADSAMQYFGYAQHRSGFIIMGDEVVDNPAGILKGERGFGADRASLDGFVPALYLAVAPGVSGRDADVGHLAKADEVLEIAGNEPGAVIGDDTRAGLRELFSSAPEDDFYILFGHRFGYACMISRNEVILDL